MNSWYAEEFVHLTCKRLNNREALSKRSQAIKEELEQEASLADKAKAEAQLALDQVVAQTRKLVAEVQEKVRWTFPCNSKHRSNSRKFVRFLQLLNSRWLNWPLPKTLSYPRLTVMLVRCPNLS